jgi:hypothetical protein
MDFVRVACVVLATTALMSACAASAARSSAKVPLEIPEPPPRGEIAPVPATDIPAPERPLPAPSVRTTAPPLPAPSAAAASPPPATPPPVVVTPEPARPLPPPELRPSGSAGLTQSAGQVREALGRTKQKLDLIDRRRLNPGKRADYDSARRFLAQAEGAVAANNLMLAQSSAEKAETLADGLR